MNVKTNSPSEAFKTVDLNGREMIRGDRFTLAICTVNSSTEKKNTMKLSMDAAIIPTAARAPWTPKLKIRTSSVEFKTRTNGAQTRAANMEATGTTQSEFL